MNETSLSFTADFVGIYKTSQQKKSMERVQEILSGKSLKMPSKHVSIFNDMVTNKKNFPSKSISNMIRDAYKKAGISDWAIVDLKLPTDERDEHAKHLPNYSTFFRQAELINTAFEQEHVDIKAQIGSDYADVKLMVMAANGKEVCTLDLPLASLTEIINKFQN